jgi:hypothetical protein
LTIEEMAASNSDSPNYSFDMFNESVEPIIDTMGLEREAVVC